MSKETPEQVRVRLTRNLLEVDATYDRRHLAEQVYQLARIADALEMLAGMYMPADAIGEAIGETIGKTPEWREGIDTNKQ